MVVVLSLSVALDLSITILLQIYLRQIHSRVQVRYVNKCNVIYIRWLTQILGCRSTRNVVYWLTYYALSTGVLTAYVVHWHYLR